MAALSINRRLQLVVPLARDDGALVVAYAEPVGQHVFDRYFMVLGKTFNAIFAQGLGVTAGPRIAYSILKGTAEALEVGRTDKGEVINAWTGPEGVELGLVGEMRRLTSVFCPREGGGWEQKMLQDAVTRGVLDADDEREVLNALTFFTVVWWVNRKSERAAILQDAGAFTGWGVTSSPITEFQSSLATLTPGESTGERETPPSIAPSTGSPAPASATSPRRQASTIPM